VLRRWRDQAPAGDIEQSESTVALELGALAQFIQRPLDQFPHFALGVDTQSGVGLVRDEPIRQANRSRDAIDRLLRAERGAEHGQEGGKRQQHGQPL